MSGVFARFLERAMVALRLEHPPAFARMLHALNGREIWLAVDAERVLLAFDAQARFLPSSSGPADIRLQTSRATVLALVDGACSMEEAVRTDALRLFGAPADLIRFHDGLLAWLHGAVRSPTFPRLLRAYRADGLEA